MWGRGMCQRGMSSASPASTPKMPSVVHNTGEGAGRGVFREACTAPPPRMVTRELSHVWCCLRRHLRHTGSQQ